VTRSVAPAEPLPATVWAIGGGKGGIGKTFMAVNVAAVAARSGRKVVLIDADLGGANLHTCLGVKAGSRVNLSDYFEDRVQDLEKAAIETSVPGLRLIMGALAHTGTAETTYEQRAQLVKAVRELKADLVIFDLAAGMDRSTLDFFLEADESMLVTTPEPTAIENAYAFLRAAFFRRLGHGLRTSPVKEVVRVAMDQRNERGIRTPTDLIREIDKVDPEEGARFRQLMASFSPRLVVNQIRSRDEVKIGFSISSVCRKYFGIEVDYLGYVNYDDLIWRSVKERQPLVLAYPKSDGAVYVRQIVRKMLRE
jgi:flagellar biosynthesis protein FlhG